VTPREFHAYQLQVRERLGDDGDVLRDDDGAPLRDDALHRAGRLFQACAALRSTPLTMAAAP
jgi:hypothetical protein